MKNKIRLVILIIIISILLSITVVYAAIKYNSADVLINKQTGLFSNNLEDAIDELDALIKSPTNCPSKTMTCKKDAYICKRATTLHTATCSQDAGSCNNVEGYNKTITFGQLGTTGVLRPGDAFDCKVSTTGGYTERFYYVSDYYDTQLKKFNSEVAVLIYYTYTYNGSASESVVHYDDSGENWHGPQTAVTHLPTTSSWNNINLYKSKRKILTENNSTSTTGGTLPRDFSYEGKAARLLTYQELYNACYTNEKKITYAFSINNCTFLFEKTDYVRSGTPYRWWLETPESSNDHYIYYLGASNRNISSITPDYNYNGVRPVIEVLKSDISY